MTLLQTNSNLFPSLMDTFFNDDWNIKLPTSRVSSPSVNIVENKNDFQLTFAIPGMNKKDFKIEVENDCLIVSSNITKKKEEKDDEGNFTHREFYYDSFKRSFSLPETVDKEKIGANYENGLLLITLPKTEAALPQPKREIEIV